MWLLIGFNDFTQVILFSDQLGRIALTMAFFFGFDGSEEDQSGDLPYMSKIWCLRRG